jgi:hypothetical protein
MKIFEDYYEFESTGRIVNTHGTAYIGIDVYADISDVAMGYDSPFLVSDEEGSNEMTEEEKTELADFMIEKWTEFKKPFKF